MLDLKVLMDVLQLVMDGRHGCEGGSICVGVSINVDHNIKFIFNDRNIDNELS